MRSLIGYPTYEGLTIELESVRLSLELRNKCIKVLEEKIEHLLAVVAKLSSGTIDDIKDDVKETVSMIQEVDNFLFDMELYFNATKNDSDEGRLKIVSMYLTNNAKLWCCTKVEETISGQCFINSWDNFKKELKTQFYPENVAYNARCKLADQQQTSSICDYVRDFSTLMLDIKDISEIDMVFNFLKGLKPWAKYELMRLNVKEISVALSTIKSLDDYSNSAPKRKFNPPQGSDNRPNKWGKT
ncbi:hypothetical protein GH714_019965 [Hevea brasiliensis]|uniref:Retrotransposon gag domain-containing protein n=1 Tax=Hevea brasiliensis TaxID=3981 RepID=A0A6A6MY33_HEVBR|nr:hypothetical protein GH714_019965 [Hevea brasiliensis]